MKRRDLIKNGFFSFVAGLFGWRKAPAAGLPLVHRRRRPERLTIMADTPLPLLADRVAADLRKELLTRFPYEELDTRCWHSPESATPEVRKLHEDNMACSEPSICLDPKQIEREIGAPRDEYSERLRFGAEAAKMFFSTEFRGGDWDIGLMVRCSATMIANWALQDPGHFYFTPQVQDEQNLPSFRESATGISFSDGHVEAANRGVAIVLRRYWSESMDCLVLALCFCVWRFKGEARERDDRRLEEETNQRVDKLIAEAESDLANGENQD